MSSAKVKVVMGLAAVGTIGCILALSGGKAKAATGEPKAAPEKLPPAKEPDARSDAAALAAARKARAISRATGKPDEGAFQTAVAAAIASRSPDIIRQSAEELAKAGYKFAPELLAIGKELAKKSSGKKRATVEDVAQVVKTPPAKASPMPALREPVPKPSPKPTAPHPAPDGAPKGPTKAFADGYADARDLVTYLAGTKKGREDRRVVELYQTKHGLKPDGQYGPRTAGDVASFGIVPPTPWYWPTNWVQAKKDYRAVLNDAGKQYPAKAAEFAVAAGKVTV